MKKSMFAVAALFFASIGSTSVFAEEWAATSELPAAFAAIDGDVSRTLTISEAEAVRGEGLCLNGLLGIGVRANVNANANVLGAVRVNANVRANVRVGIR